MFRKIWLLFVLTLFLGFGKIKAEVLSQTNMPALFFVQNGLTQQVPDEAVFYQKEGEPVKLSAYQGKVLVLNFFKVSCRKCLLELPSLNALKNKIPEIEIVAVSEGEENALIVDNVLHRERLLTNITTGLDNNQKLLHLLNGEKVPRTLLIDKKGRIRGFIQGQADFNSLQLVEQVKNLLGE